jgi:hypothetical protein
MRPSATSKYIILAFEADLLSTRVESLGLLSFDPLLSTTVSYAANSDKAVTVATQSSPTFLRKFLSKTLNAFVAGLN